MRYTRIFILIALIPLGPGCELPLGSGFEIGTMQAAICSRRRWTAATTASSGWGYRHLGKQALDGSAQPTPRESYSVHFGRGFVDGFADFSTPVEPGDRLSCRRGVTGGPPVRTPEGNQSVEDWFAGFRQGTRTAQASGLRNLVLVPLSYGSASPPPPIPLPAAEPLKHCLSPRN